MVHSRAGIGGAVGRPAAPFGAACPEGFWLAEWHGCSALIWVNRRLLSGSYPDVPLI